MANNRRVTVVNPLEEIWIPIPYGIYYSISNQGNVFSSFIDRNLKTYADKDGYLCVDLCYNRIYRKAKVHRLVLEGFVGPCPSGMESYHKDNNRANNVLTNLKWATPSENKQFIVVSGNNLNSNKERCPYNHLYVPENLDVSKARLGHRKCKSCEYGRQANRFNSSRNRREEADKYYATLGIE